MRVWRSRACGVVGVFAAGLMTVVAHAQVAPCGGNCGMGTAPICVVAGGTASVNVINACGGGDLELEVSLGGPFQSAAVTVQVYAPNYTFRDIKIRSITSTAAVSLSVIPAGSGSIGAIRNVFQ